VSLSTTAINDRHASHRHGFRSTVGIHQKRPVRLSHGLPCLGRDVVGLSQAPSKSKINHRTQRSVARYVGQAAKWSDQQGCQKYFTLWLKRCTKADDEQLEHTKWLHCQTSDIIVKYRYLKRKHCVVSLTLFSCVSVQTFFSARKSLSGCTKISITSSYLKIVKCHMAVTCS